MPDLRRSVFPIIEEFDEDPDAAPLPEPEPAEKHARAGWLDVGLEAAATLYFIGASAGCLSLLFGGWPAAHPMTPIAVAGAVCHMHRRPLTWKTRSCGQRCRRGMVSFHRRGERNPPLARANSDRGIFGGGLCIG
jgi:hypothetical protein